jgi:alkanesulfonate monooxygenase SsuD/methylene tetrahydromethanopterin reductase-like flavin-dependent oxidoreductase (luciferase family)
VHDIVSLEGSGIASVMVASAEFVEAAQTQADALGADPRRVFVEHPIQDRTDEEMRAIADAVVDELLGTLIENEGVGS